MLCPEEFVLITTAIGLSLSQGKSLEELALLSGIFSQLSTVISSVAIQKTNIATVCNGQNGSANSNSLLEETTIASSSS